MAPVASESELLLVLLIKRHSMSGIMTPASRVNLQQYQVPNLDRALRILEYMAWAKKSGWKPTRYRNAWVADPAAVGTDLQRNQQRNQPRK
jgi:hypothetical protein